MNAGCELPEGRVDVWLADPAACRDEGLLHAYHALLSPQERDQHRRFVFDSDRHRYLVTRALVRTVLDRYVGIGIERWDFAVSAYGKPRVSSSHPVAARLSFNVSHTTGLVAVAVTIDRAVGIDVEDTLRAAPFAVAEAYFSADEVLSLSACLPQQRASRFWELWTLKESYIKARGMGLSLPLDSFGFSLDESRSVRLTSAGEPVGGWWFCQWRASADHVMAVCVERDCAAPPAPLVRRVVPLRDECIESLDPLRVS